MNKVDLHVHTTFSDGEYSIEEIIDLAISKNLEMIAITDHDTVTGIKHIFNHQEILDKNIDIIPGIELSTSYFGGDLHIVGYNIDPYNEELTNLLENSKKQFVYYFLGLLTKLNELYNIKFTKEEIIEVLSQDKRVGRVDLAKLLMKHNYVEKMQDAFDKYLQNVKKSLTTTADNPHPKECIKAIIAAGGIASFAHPGIHELPANELDELVKELSSYGLQSLEIYNRRHTEEEIMEYSIIAKKYNLLTSGGSDYHGPISTPDDELGGLAKSNEEITIINSLKKIIK